MITRANQALTDIWLQSESTVSAVELISQLVREDFTVLKEFSFAYQPIGITHVLVLSESHCIVHTYPEENYLSIDLYVCNLNIDLKQFLKKVYEKLDIKKVDEKHITRGDSSR